MFLSYTTTRINIHAELSIQVGSTDHTIQVLCPRIFAMPIFLRTLLEGLHCSSLAIYYTEKDFPPNNVTAPNDKI